MKKISFLILSFFILLAPAMAEAGLNEPKASFSYDGKPIHPLLIAEFFNWMSDYRPPIVTSVDVKSAFDTNQYSKDDVKVDNGWVRADRDEGGYFQYKWLGQLENGMHVLQTADSGGGSGIFMDLLVLKESTAESSWSEGKYTQNLLSVVRSVGLGDRFDGDIRLLDNMVFVSGSGDREPKTFDFSDNETDVEQEVVELKYNKPVHGLSVRVLWMPKEFRNQHVLGPAIIELTNLEHGTSSTVVNNHFGIKADRLEGSIDKVQAEEEGGHVVNILKKDIGLQYADPKIAEEEYNFGTDEEPFFFYDINFDGRDDFILVEMYNAQRGGHSYKAYDLADSQDIWVLEDDYLQITNKEPYRLLDYSTTVDRQKKTIAIHVSAGAVYSYQDIYAITTDGFTKTSTEYPEALPNASDYFHEKPDKLCGEPKQTPDGKREYVLIPAWETSCALYEHNLEHNIYRYISPALNVWLITKGEHSGGLIVEMHEYFALGGAGSYDWLWIISPYGEKLNPLGSANEVDWEMIEEIYGIKK